MSIRGKWAPGKTNTQSKWTLGANGYLGQGALRACGDWDKWIFGEMGALGPMSIGAVGIGGKWALGKNGHQGK